MFLTNHALTGCLIGLTLDDYELIIPASVASHFVMDAIPHWGMADLDLHSRLGRVLGFLDVAGTVIVTAAAASAHPQRAGHVIAGSIGAVAPDLFDHIPYGLFGIHLWPWGHKWHSWIQKYQKPPGALVELLWGMLMSGLVFRL